VCECVSFYYIMRDCVLFLSCIVGLCIICCMLVNCTRSVCGGIVVSLTYVCLILTCSISGGGIADYGFFGTK
jgi:hypothetical protein